jgi:hypothetical protein
MRTIREMSLSLGVVRLQIFFAHHQVGKRCRLILKLVLLTTYLLVIKTSHPHKRLFKVQPVKLIRSTEKSVDSTRLFLNSSTQTNNRGGAESRTRVLLNFNNTSTNYFFVTHLGYFLHRYHAYTYHYFYL